MNELYRVIINQFLNDGNTRTIVYHEGDSLAIAIDEAHGLICKGLGAGQVDIMAQSEKTADLWLSVWGDEYLEEVGI